MSAKYRFEAETSTVFFVESGSKLKLLSCSRDGEWTLRLDWRGQTFPVIARLERLGTPPGIVYWNWTIVNLPGAALNVPTDKFASDRDRAEAIGKTAEAMSHMLGYGGPLPGEIPQISVALSKSLKIAVELAG